MLPNSILHRDVQRLIVRMPNWVGDAVMATPALRAVRQSFPDAHLALVTNPLVAELFQSHPACDEVLVYDKQGLHCGLTGRLRFCAGLRRERYDLAILLQNAFEAALLTLCAGIRRRLGYKTDGRGLLLTDGVAAVDKKHGLHHVDYYLQMLETQGISGGSGELEIHLSAAEEAWAEKQFPGDDWLVINPGASYGAAKRWFPDRFAAVAKALAMSHGLRPVITGGPGEVEIAADIEAALGDSAVNLAGRTSLRQLMALLGHCRLVITNDSGPMHLAAALRTPLVAIFGPTDHLTTSPRGENWRLVRQEVDCSPCLLRSCPTDHRCMTRVSAEMVVRAAEELLDAGS